MPESLLTGDVPSTAPKTASDPEFTPAAARVLFDAKAPSLPFKADDPPERKLFDRGSIGQYAPALEEFASDVAVVDPVAAGRATSELTDFFRDHEFTGDDAALLMAHVRRASTSDEPRDEITARRRLARDFGVHANEALRAAGALASKSETLRALAPKLKNDPELLSVLGRLGLERVRAGKLSI